MTRKVIVYIATSLDGYIADENGSVAWLDDHTESHDYDDFIRNIDTVIMGKTTYHQVTQELSKDVWPYGGMLTYVVTHQPYQNQDEIIFYQDDLKTLINTLKSQDGKDIWICGVASIINQLMKEDLIDQYHITIAPKLLGNGIALFGKFPSQTLKLIQSYEDGPFVHLVYERD